MEIIITYIQSEAFLLKAELFLRLVIAVLCGAFIGYERKHRGKGAGTRTHSIVAIASCLMMIISQYGFEDFFNNFNLIGIEKRIDPSRVAAQIVSGIGFLGAGMIFIQKNVVTGLTTAAGIWATAGIGMAIGGGMYFLGIACTAIIVILQHLLHRNPKLSSTIVENEMHFCIDDDNIKNIDALLELIEKFGISILEISYSKNNDGSLDIIILAQYLNNVDKIPLLEEIYKMNFVKTAKV